MHYVCTVVENNKRHSPEKSLTLFIFETLVGTTHSFSGMGYFLFGYGKEEWRNEVAKR